MRRKTISAFEGWQRQARVTIKPRRSESSARQRMQKLQSAFDLHMGRRQPRSWSEQSDLEWASPSKRKQQFAATGNYRIPRIEGLRRERSLSRVLPEPRNVTKRTSSGRVVVDRGYGQGHEYADAAGYLKHIWRTRNLAARSGSGEATDA